MKKTSRRIFGKQLIAAVALPIVSTSMTESASAQNQSRTDTEGIETTHNTPPPITIMDGSLIVESQDQFEESGTTTPFYYRGTNTVRPDLGHIRVIQDNGDKLYEDLEAVGTEITIVCQNQDQNREGTLIIKKNGNAFEIKSDKKLSKREVFKRRKYQYDHPGPGGGKRIRILSIEIKNKMGLKTTLTAPDATGDLFLPHEFRVLIWRH